VRLIVASVFPGSPRTVTLVASFFSRREDFSCSL
jgi:hypothetical protein